MTTHPDVEKIETAVLDAGRDAYVREGKRPVLLVLVGHRLHGELVKIAHPAAEMAWSFRDGVVRVFHAEVHPVDEPLVGLDRWRLVRVIGETA